MQRHANDRQGTVRDAGALRLTREATVKKFLLAVVVLAFAVALMAPRVPAQTASLIFDRPPAQGPGTQGGGVISDPTIQPSSGWISTGASIDLQGNGRPDVVVCHGSFPPSPAVKQPCRVLRPQPDGSVVDITRQLFGPGALPSSIHPREIVSGDFNRDGRADIFVAAHGYDTAPFPGETNLLLISNADGSYTDRSPTLPQVSAFTHSACVGDINGDGSLDIYVGNNGGQTNVPPYFLMGRGDGTFTQKTTGLPPEIRNAQASYRSCLLVDVDRDMRDDVLLGGHAQGSASVVLFNDGAGDFTIRPRLVLPLGQQLPADNFIVLDIVSPDVNVDGRADLILLSSAERSNSGVGLQVLINQGNGTFVDETAVRLGPSIARVTGPVYPFIRLADFNGDGLHDFYLEQVGGDDDGLPRPRIWLNNGNGTFTALAPSSLPQDFTSRASLFSVDFDGDWRPDIVQLDGPISGPPPAGAFIAYRSFLNRTPSTVPVGPPGAPGTPTASVNGNVVTFSWTAPTTGAAPTYTLLGRLIAGGPVIARLPVGNATSFTVSAPNGTFIVSLQATNAQGTGPESAGVTFSVPAVPLAPGAPGNFAALVSGSTVNFTWTTPATGGAPAMYLMVASLTPGGPAIASLPIAANAESYNVPNVPLGTYYVRLFAQNLGGSSPASNEVPVTITAPAAPNAPVLNTAQISGTAVTLTWTPSASGGTPTGYIVSASLAPAGAAIGSVPTSSPTLTVASVPLGTYYVTVHATNAVGTSPASNEITVAVR